MIYYLAPILIGLLLSFNEVKLASIRRNSAFKNLFLLFTAIIFCGGYMTGSDWVNYELLYNEASISNLVYYTHERGFYFLMLIFKTIGFGFFPFLITLKFFFFYSMASFIKKHFKSFYLPFTLFLMGGALFLLVDNPLRFMIALTIVVISYDYLIDRKLIKYLILILIASTFHISSLIMIPLYFISYNKLSKKQLIVIYFILFFVLDPGIMIKLLSFFPGLLKRIASYYQKMHEISYNKYALGKIVYSVILLIVVFFDKTIKKQFKHGERIYSLTISYFMLSLIGFIVPTTFRLKFFVAPFYFLSLASVMLYSLKYKLLIRAFLILYLSFTTIRGIYTTWVYIPYSNYFISLFQNEKSYNERSQYNKIKYRERTGSWPDELNDNE